MGRKKTIKTIDELLENSKTDQQPQEENLVKKTCRELGITQKELAERIGLTESGLKTALLRKSFSEQIVTSIQLLLELHKLQIEIENTKQFKLNLKQFLEL
jgi:transcriptional regulator with XRE-family HTH domain